MARALHGSEIESFSSDLRRAAAARRRNLGAENRMGGIESRNKQGGAICQDPRRGGRRICNLRERLTGRARAVVSQQVTLTQHGTMGARPVAEVAQLMEHRSVLGDQQQQR